MGRPIYPYELNDPDFSWLISNFQENHPEYSFIESSCLPVVFIEDREGLGLKQMEVPAELLEQGEEEDAADCCGEEN